MLLYWPKSWAVAFCHLLFGSMLAFSPHWNCTLMSRQPITLLSGGQFWLQEVGGCCSPSGTSPRSQKLATTLDFFISPHPSSISSLPTVQQVPSHCPDSHPETTPLPQTPAVQCPSLKKLLVASSECNSISAESIRKLHGCLYFMAVFLAERIHFVSPPPSFLGNALWGIVSKTFLLQKQIESSVDKSPPPPVATEPYAAIKRIQPDQTEVHQDQPTVSNTGQPQRAFVFFSFCP